MTIYLDTNILVRHLTQDPPDMGRRASAFLAAAEQLHLPDLIVAEVLYVLQSVYRVDRPRLAGLLRAVIGSRNIMCDDPALLLRAIDVYEHDRLAFADAYLIALSENGGPDSKVASFDRGIDRVRGVVRVEP